MTTKRKKIWFLPLKRCGSAMTEWARSSPAGGETRRPYRREWAGRPCGGRWAPDRWKRQTTNRSQCHGSCYWLAAGYGWRRRPAAAREYPFRKVIACRWASQIGPCGSRDPTSPRSTCDPVDPFDAAISQCRLPSCNKDEQVGESVKLEKPTADPHFVFVLFVSFFWRKSQLYIVV